MSTHADELARLLLRQDLVVGRSQALQHVSAKCIRVRLESGRWRLAARGVYLAHDGPITRQQARWIAVLAVGAARPAVLAGLSALDQGGLRGHAPKAIHVLIPVGSRDRHAPDGVVVHRSSQLLQSDIDQHGQPPRTVPARSLVDAAQWAASDGEARAILTAGFRQGLVGSEEVLAVLDRMPRAHRRLLTRKAAVAAGTGAHVLPEAEFLRLCHRGGLPKPAKLTPRRDSDGRWRYLDVYFEEWKLQVEIDSGRNPPEGDQLWTPDGQPVRVTAWAIRHRPDEVIAQILDGRSISYGIALVGLKPGPLRAPSR